MFSEEHATTKFSIPSWNVSLMAIDEDNIDQTTLELKVDERKMETHSNERRVSLSKIVKRKKDIDTEDESPSIFALLRSSHAVGNTMSYYLTNTNQLP